MSFIISNRQKVNPWTTLVIFLQPASGTVCQYVSPLHSTLVIFLSGTVRRWKAIYKLYIPLWLYSYY